MMTMSSGWSVALLAVGLLMLLSLFACLNGGRYYDMLAALKRNRAIAGEGKQARRTFEETQVKMRNAVSFPEWWGALCGMSDQMHFQSIGLWKRCESEHVRICTWMARSDKFPTRKVTELRLPVSCQGEERWQIRAQVWVNGCLEIGGHEMTLLARLMDEFPPPSSEQEAKRPSSVQAECVSSGVIQEEYAGYEGRNYAECGQPHLYPRPA
jgi:hypothetical protein